MSVQGTIKVALALVEGATVDLGSATRQINGAFSLTLENGTGDNQADLVFADQRTLAASATENLDLAGTLAQTFGATLTITNRAIMQFEPLAQKVCNGNGPASGGHP